MSQSGSPFEQGREEMRLHSDSPAYKELHRRLDSVRYDPVNMGLTDAEMDQKLRETRDSYMRELREGVK
jgi:hypothetical protein